MLRINRLFSCCQQNLPIEYEVEEEGQNVTQPKKNILVRNEGFYYEDQDIPLPYQSKECDVSSSRLDEEILKNEYNNDNDVTIKNNSPRKDPEIATLNNDKNAPSSLRKSGILLAISETSRQNDTIVNRTNRDWKLSMMIIEKLQHHWILTISILLPITINLMNTVGEAELKWGNQLSLYIATLIPLNIKLFVADFIHKCCLDLVPKAWIAMAAYVWFLILMMKGSRSTTRRHKMKLDKMSLSSKFPLLSNAAFPTVTPESNESILKIPSNVLDVKEFRVEQSTAWDDDDNTGIYESDVDWFYKHCLGIPTTLTALDSFSWKLDGHRRHLSGEAIEKTYTREDWWMSKLDLIEVKFLRMVVKAVFGSLSVYHGQKSERKDASILFNYVQRVWATCEDSPLPHPSTWKNRPVYARLVLSRKEAIRLIRQLIYKKLLNPELLSWSPPREDSVVSHRKNSHTDHHIRRKTTDPFDFEEGSTLEYFKTVSLDFPLELDINCDLRTHEAWGAVKEFETELFKGRVLLRLNGLASSKYTTYFEARKRLMQCVIQGRFKKRVAFNQILTGQIWKKPFQRLPPRFILKVIIGLIAKVLPSVVAQFNGEQPYFVLPLVASLQTLIVTRLGQSIPVITNQDLKEDCELLIKAGDPTHWAKDKDARRSFFSHANNLVDRYFEPNYIYTMETYQHLFDVSTYQVKFPFKSFNLNNYINDQPIEINAFLERQLNTESPSLVTDFNQFEHLINNSRDYLWRIQLCHEDLIGSWI